MRLIYKDIKGGKLTGVIGIEPSMICVSSF